MINEEKISEIQKKIEASISDQVKNGKQSSALPDDYKACGQFFNIKDRPQRGLHGTSSALKVLALSTNDNIKDSIPPIIKYLTDHVSVETQLLGQSDPQEAIKRNETNVIKISECLYSLSYVKSGFGNKEQIVESLTSKLKNGKLEDKGWGYFISTPNNKIELLPTTFAALAIFSNSFPGYESTYEYIVSEIEIKITHADLDLTTYSILVFALYVITFYYSPQINNRTTIKKLKSLYKKLWKNNYCIFNEDIEQNIEYWNEDDHYYVRIPWQLYMLALTSKFSSWNFAKVDSQKRLTSIYTNCANNEGFRYRYSGPYFSVRTHAIIYETLEKIRQNLKKNALYVFFNRIDQIRNLLAHRFFRFGISILSFVLAGYIIYDWYQDDNSTFRELAPELLGPVFVWLIMFGKKK